MKILGNWSLCAVLVWMLGLGGTSAYGYAKPKRHTVFEIYAVASRDWWNGEENLYAYQPETDEIFRYSPLFAIATSPLAYLPPGVGHAIWKILNGAAFAGAMGYWLRRGILQKFSPNEIGVALLLSLPVGLLSLHTAQATMIMVGLMMVATVAISQDRWWLAGGLMAGATLIKVYPIAFAAVLAVVFWRQFSWRFAVCLAVGLLLPIFAQSPEYAFDQTLKWFGQLLAGAEINRERLKSLDGLLEILGLSLPRNVFLGLGAFAGLGVLVVTWVYHVRAAKRAETLSISLAWYIAWVLLFSPATEPVTFSILAAAIAWAIIVAFRRPGAWIDRGILAVSLFLIGPIQTDLVGKAGREWGGSFAAPTWGTLLFVAWLTMELVRFLISTRTAASSSPASSPARSTGRSEPGPG